MTSRMTVPGLGRPGRIAGSAALGPRGADPAADEDRAAVVGGPPPAHRPGLDARRRPDLHPVDNSG
ncbi:hypothetical protein ABZY10_03865 [Streptomyces sp. NPDC006539]|uniref:hypothetical protein n=1 Tax=Streptomyces sp. NPDC006539 TaxID=3155352 RepID=UPI0033BED6F1